MWAPARGDLPEWFTDRFPGTLTSLRLFDDPRAEVIFDDGHALVMRSSESFDVIVVDEPPDGDAWRAIRDRLTRAAARGPAGDEESAEE